jgi:hypothetical protein
MKTRLSFLALPFCVGLVLTFVLAACTSDGGGGSGGSNSSSSGAVYTPSSEVSASEVVFDGFGVGEPEYDIIILKGYIDAAPADPIVKLEFKGIQPGWVSYKDAPVNGSVSLNTSRVKLADYEIKLENPSIPCGSHNFTVEACTAKNTCSTKNGTFTKEAYLCALSSSAGALLSSSSEATWKFGAPVIVDASINTQIPMGTGYLRIVEDSQSGIIEVTNGKIRRVEAISDDDVVPGKSYSSSESLLGSKPATALSDDLQNNEYYMVYLNDNSKYLVQFTKKGASWSSWPKTCTYWLALESP